MKVRMEGNDPCVFLVSSESDGGKTYVVDICVHPLGLDADGDMAYNGACVSTRTENEWTEYGCEAFRYTCQPKLDKPENMGKAFRCKHVRCAREYALKALIPYMANHRPNHGQ